MKKLNLLTVLIASMALLATGCHRHPSLTPIPGMGAPEGQVGSGGTTGGGTAGTGSDVSSAPVTRGPDGTIPPSNVPEGAEDRQTLAGDTIYFDFDRATIKSSEESKLSEVANYLKANPGKYLKIEGNCDERGTEKYNLSLGERRALAAREYLANLGIDATRIKTVTYGASKPVDPGHNEDAWKKNRRDDMVVITPQ